MKRARQDQYKVSLSLFRDLLDQSGNEDYLVATVRDITDRKWTESVLVNSEHRFRILVEHSLVGFYFIQHGHLIYANPHLAQCFGYESEAMMNKPVAE